MRPELGELTLWGALLLPAMYIVNHGVRRVNTWRERRRPRHRNVGFLMIFYSLLGALVGSFCQPVWTRSAACTHDRRGVVACLVDDVAEPAIESAREAGPALEHAGEKLRAGESELERRLDPDGRLDPVREPEPERRPEPARERPPTSQRQPPSGNP